MTVPYVYAALEASGGAVVGHLDAPCKAMWDHWWSATGADHADPWPCAVCVSLEQLEAWARAVPEASARGWARSGGEAAAEIFRVFSPETKDIASTSRYTGCTATDTTSEDTTMNAQITRPTTEKFSTLKALFADVIDAEVPGMAQLRSTLLGVYKAGQLDAETVDQAISLLAGIVNPCNDDQPAPVYDKLPGQAPAAPAQPTGPAFEKGMIVTNAAGQIVRLYARKADGKLYGKVRDEYGSWEYAPGAMKGARHLTADEARAIGIRTERCVFCATPLSDPTSVTVGFGEICASRYGLPWGNNRGKGRH